MFLDMLLAAFLVVCLAISNTEARYGQINDYLTKRLDNDDVSSNLKAAVGWLKELEGVKQTLFSRAPISDLRTFSALQQVIEDTNCDGSSYEIMLANERAVELHHLIYNNKVTRRVDKVMLKIFQEHAHRCSKVYPLIYKTKREQLDIISLERLKKIVDKVIETDKAYYHYAYTSSDLFKQFVARPFTIERANRRETFYNAFISIVKDSPDSHHILGVLDENSGTKLYKWDKIAELIRENLIEPCKSYVSYFKIDPFTWAKFDAKTYNAVAENDLDYYYGWSALGICQVVVDYEKVVVFNVLYSVALHSAQPGL